MYHDIREYPVEGNDYIVSLDTFIRQIQTLFSQGHRFVTFDDIIAYVDYGVELPHRPVVITFDDGYLSNLELAAPVLEHFGISAIVNIVGTQMGQSTYRHTYVHTIPYFSFEQAQPYVERGVIQIGHHSYDMHQVYWVETTWSGADPTIPFRRGVLQHAYESDDEYRAAFTQDFNTLRDLIDYHFGKPVTVFAYPYGFYNADTEEMLRELGVRVTLTSNPGISRIERGNPDSLLLLPRINMEEDMTDEKLIGILNRLWGD